MTPDHDEPLDMQERELAGRLARLAASAEPSPALDARVLAAARMAAGGASSPAKPGRPGWPMGLGVAASLVLAAGVAWQLRPLPDAGRPTGEVMDAAQRVDPGAPGTGRAPSAPTPAEGHDDAATAVAAPAIPQDDQADAPATAQESAASTAKAGGVRRPAEATAAAPAADPGDGGPEAPSRESPAPVSQSQPAAATATSATSTSVAPSRRTSAAARADEAATGDRRQRSLAESGARASAASDAPVDAADDAFHDEPFDEEPPASADSPEVRRAWLARIRELVAEGRLEAARASLGEFRRRYPLAPLPDDLRSLAD